MSGEVEEEAAAGHEAPVEEPLVTIPLADLLVAVQQPTDEQRLIAVTSVLSCHRVHVVEESGQASAILETPVIDPKVLADKLVGIPDPNIIDPSENVEQEAGSVEEKMSRKGICRQFDLSCQLYVRYGYERESVQSKAKNTKDQEMLYSSRILAYTCEKLGLDVKSINDPNKVAECLSSKYVIEYLEIAKSCHVSNSLMHATINATKRLMDFLMFSMDSWARQVHPFMVMNIRMRKESIDYWVASLKGTSSKKRKALIASSDEPPKKKALKSGPTFREIRSMFQFGITKRLISECIIAFSDPHLTLGSIDPDQYLFFVWYCMGIVSIYYGKRPQVSGNMKVKEWANRTVRGDGSVVITVADTKTAESSGPEEVYLTAEQAEHFEMYFDKLRQKIKPVSHPTINMDWFFLQLKNPLHQFNQSRLLMEFQMKIGYLPVLTQREIRHVIETESADRFKDDSKSRRAICRMLGHTLAVANREYVDEEELDGDLDIFVCKEAMDRLESPDQAPHQFVAVPAIDPLTPKGKREKYLIETKSSMTAESQVPTVGEIQKLPDDHFESDMSPAEKNSIAQKMHDELKRMQEEHRKGYIISVVMEEYLKAKEMEGEPVVAAKPKKESVKGKRGRSSAPIVKSLDDELLEMSEMVAKEKGWTNIGALQMRLLPRLRLSISQAQVEIETMKEKQKENPAPEQKEREEELEEHMEMEEQVGGEEEIIEQSLGEVMHQQQPSSAREEIVEQSVTIEEGAKGDGKDGGNQSTKDDDEDEKSQKESGDEESGSGEEESGSGDEEFGSGDEEPTSGNEESGSGDEDQSSKDEPSTSGQGSRVRESAQRKKSRYNNDDLIRMSKTNGWLGLDKVKLDVRGQGVVATKDFKVGEYICDYSGKLCSKTELSQVLNMLSQQMKDPDMLTQEKRSKKCQFNVIGEYRLDLEYGNISLSIDASEDNGSYGRLINHTPNYATCANVEPKMIEVTYPDGSMNPMVIFKARKNIKVGHELLWQYSSTGAWKKENLKCPCHRKKCKLEWDHFHKKN